MRTTHEPAPRRRGPSTLQALLPLPVLLALGGAGDIAWIDLDGDGALDLFVANSDGPEKLFVQRDGTLVDATAQYGLDGAEFSFTAWEDFDLDGDMDLLAQNGARSMLLLNDGQALVDVSVVAGLVHGGDDLDAAWNDANADGWPDLEIVQRSRRIVYANVGNGSFVPTELPLPLVGEGSLGWIPAGIGIAGGDGSTATTTAAPRDESERRAVAGTTLFGGDADGLGSKAGPNAVPVPTGTALGAVGSAVCSTGLIDVDTGVCVSAASVPSLGTLLPLGPEFYVAKTGEVGMGTTAPDGDLHVRDAEALVIVQGTSPDADVRSEVRLATTSVNTGFGLKNTGTQFQLSTVNGPFGPHMVVTSGLGRVGINEATPEARLHLTDPFVAPQVIISGGSSAAQLLIEADDDNSGEFDNASVRMTQDGGAISGLVGFQEGTNNFAFENEFADTSLLIGDNGAVLVTDGAVGAATLELDPDVHGGGQFVTYDTAGNVMTSLDTDSVGGAGRMRLWNPASSTPRVLLEAEQGVTGGNFELRNAAGFRTFMADSEFNVGGSCRVEICDEQGVDNIAMDGGTGRIRAGSLELTGGSDIAEPFDVAGDDVQPGMLVAIDEDIAGGLRLTAGAYERQVVGIISGAAGIRPGLTLTQTGSIADGELPVALSGRVWCMADASDAPIQPGDLLTSSEMPGHAMRASDHERSFGAVVGKAMTSLESGTGLVLVWVNLQ